MTIEELYTLKCGEMVVFTKVDSLTNQYWSYEVGDAIEFVEINRSGQKTYDVIDFLRKPYFICHFAPGICDYIERKTVLDRQTKLIELGI